MRRLGRSPRSSLSTNFHLLLTVRTSATLNRAAIWRRGALVTMDYSHDEYPVWQ
jgi:hypothetical protein